MRIHIWIVIVIVIVVAGLALWGGASIGHQVADSTGKYVKGDFISNDGVTAILKTSTSTSTSSSTAKG